MDELDNMGPVLLPEEEAKQKKEAARKSRLKWPFSRKRTIIGGTSVAVLLFLTVLGFKVHATLYRPPTTNNNASSSIAKDSVVQQSKTISGLQLNPRKTYGNKYASGILPVGDKKYTTDAPKKGSVYLCNANFVPEGQAGAQVRGPWFVNNNTEWDTHKKAAIAGSVDWTQKVSVKIENGKRIITTNDLPDHHTGVFPVAKNDPAHAYDANPNSIAEQQLTYTLNAGPGQGTTYCMGGEVGVMVNGVALFNAFDAGGRDAGAWEVQDTCDGHPQSAGEYHYHTLSRCITDVSVKTVIGFALDGYPITGPKIDKDDYLTTDDLDECHGIVSEIMLDGQTTTAYHYVMTQDFPYSVSCFKSKPTQAPGIHESAGTKQGPTQQTGTQPNSTQSTTAPPAQAPPVRKP